MASIKMNALKSLASLSTFLPGDDAAGIGASYSTFLPVRHRRAGKRGARHPSRASRAGSAGGESLCVTESDARLPGIKRSTRLARIENKQV
jgi:hypothetical protein